MKSRVLLAGFGDITCPFVTAAERVFRRPPPSPPLCAAIPIITVMKALRLATVVGVVALASAAIAGMRDARRIPFSRRSARWQVGADFFDRRGLVDSETAVRGLTDSMDVFRRSDLPTDQIDVGVREFYEDTQNHLLLNSALRVLESLRAKR